MKEDRKGIAVRSEVANKLLKLGEQASDTSTREALSELERLTLTSSAGPSEHPKCRELMKMLDDAQDILSGGNLPQRSDYLERLRKGILLWQGAKEYVGRSGMDIRDLFSKKAREEKRKKLLIPNLRSNVFMLEQRRDRVQAKIEKTEGERASLLKKAAAEAPGSRQYTILKSRYDILGMQLKSDMFEFSAVGNVLQTNVTYLTTLESELSLDGLGSYMPVSLDKMEEDLDRSNLRVEEIVDKLNQASEVTKDAEEGRDNAFSSLTGSFAQSDFDESVKATRESQSVLSEMGVDIQDVTENQKPFETAATEKTTGSKAMSEEVKP